MSEYMRIKCDNCGNKTTDPKQSEWFVLISYKMLTFQHPYLPYEIQEDRYDLCNITCLKMFTDELEKKGE
jgi:hypothetical protein